MMIIDTKKGVACAALVLSALVGCSNGDTQDTDTNKSSDEQLEKSETPLTLKGPLAPLRFLPGIGSAILPGALEVSYCDADHLCSFEQKGSNFRAVCDGGVNVFTGTIKNGVVAWSDDAGNACSAKLAQGQLKGTCTSAGATCEVSSSDPLPAATCVELPSKVNFGGCGLPTGTCDVIQNACVWQASCSDGTVFGGNATSTGARWTAADRSSCRGTLAAADAGVDARTISGACTPPRTDAGVADAGAAAACNFTIAPPSWLPQPPTCEQLSSTLVVSGCGLETSYGDTSSDPICNVKQRGCVWSADCGDTQLAGRAHGSLYSFSPEDGTQCDGLVSRGRLAGLCHTGLKFCPFTQKTPKPASGCNQLPAQLTISGCGLDGTCLVTQNGCTWQALCNNSVSYDGLATNGGFNLYSEIDETPVTCAATIDGNTVTGSCAPSADLSTPACTFTGSTVTADGGV